MTTNHKTYQLKTNHVQRLADMITPVSIYLNLRDKFANSLLLESSDYHGNENSFSYICCQPIAKFEVADGTINRSYPDGTAFTEEATDVVGSLQRFVQQFKTDSSEFKFINNGLFGYQSYSAVQYFETLKLKPYLKKGEAIPDILYHAYRYIIAINHFNNQMYVFEHLLEGETSNMNQILSYINLKNHQVFNFKTEGEEISNVSDQQYLKMVEKGKYHCQRGDVFQIVLSRRFEQGFKGDEFNVYRALRAVNPSPYLFYFDYGSFKLFGSSPEAQLIINDTKATINPIAGTFKRTGNDEADAEAAKALALDPKENAEHVMLVDLARNDLSRHGNEVTVETYREIQFYSHVIHLVSKVTGQIKTDNKLQVMADTFPAGTLSGAPKYRAMELIDKYEPTNRSMYGGCIGFLGFNNDFNHAIIIRSFKSQNNKLYYQAGAGVVFKSDPQSELEEVGNKLGALRKALELAESI